jgi:hypothetical protein
MQDASGTVLSMPRFASRAWNPSGRTVTLTVGLLTLVGCTTSGPRARPDAGMGWVHVTTDGSGFVLRPSGCPFVPWGFNYDHDEAGRLLEEYWEAEWPKVVADFGEMQALGANVVRIHLQFGRFMCSPSAPNEAALTQFARLVQLAEQCELRLDLTGLGCYLKPDVPAWYDALDETGRWAAQAAFWGAIAERCAGSPAIFCYDLMNEPVVPGGRRAPADWLAPPFAEKYHYVQFITLDQAERSRPAIAAAWVRTLVAAIRQHDTQHLITVGLVPWSLDRPGLTSGFVPERITADLDFLCVHLYPETGHMAEAAATLAGFRVGKPVVIEETYPLACAPEELRDFLRAARRDAAGCISFYWGQTPAEGRRAGTLPAAVTATWLELFCAEGRAAQVTPSGIPSGNESGPGQ